MLLKAVKDLYLHQQNDEETTAEDHWYPHNIIAAVLLAAPTILQCRTNICEEEGNHRHLATTLAAEAAD